VIAADIALPPSTVLVHDAPRHPSCQGRVGIVSPTTTAIDPRRCVVLLFPAIGDNELVPTAIVRAEYSVVGHGADFARWVGVRPAVRAFAEAMERKLAANDHKGGWSGCNSAWLLMRLREETEELAEALHAHYVGTPADVLAEAADVANYALMISDVCGERKKEGE
jgi:NTP pyrophosphatase (non-canonical NTP hydrolase)